MFLSNQKRKKTKSKANINGSKTFFPSSSTNIRDNQPAESNIGNPSNSRVFTIHPPGLGNIFINLGLKVKIEKGKAMPHPKIKKTNTNYELDEERV